MNQKIRKERLVRIGMTDLETECLGIIKVNKLYKRVVFTNAANRTFDHDEMKYSGIGWRTHFWHKK